MTPNINYTAKLLDVFINASNAHISIQDMEDSGITIAMYKRSASRRTDFLRRALHPPHEVWNCHGCHFILPEVLMLNAHIYCNY